VSARQVQSIPRQSVPPVMQVALPAVAQLMFNGGDRHLASNLNVMRSMMVSSASDQKTYGVQATLQKQASILNPYHEDNYYIAGAVLAWEGQTDVAQFVLTRATKYRHWDFLPPFLAGFNYHYFYKDGVAAGAYANRAADRLDERQSRSMRDLAARWLSSGNELDEGIRVLEGMIRSTRDTAMKHRLAARIERVRQLKVLREAAQRYRSDFGASPTSFEALLEAGLLDTMPEDPLRRGFELDAEGQPQFSSVRAQKKS